MRSVILQHTTRDVRDALKNNCFNVYWRNSLLNTKWRVVEAKIRSGQLQVRVLHPIHAGWYAVDSTDVLSCQ